MVQRLEAWSPQLLGLLRIVAGSLFLSHGVVKLFGLPAGAMPGQQPLLSLLGLGGCIEIVTGALISIGLFTRPAAFFASGQMAVAYWMFHAPKAPLPVENGGDAAILYCFVFLCFVGVGPGKFSIDRIMRSPQDL